MAHISPDFSSKKDFKEAVKTGRQIEVWGGFGCMEQIMDGEVTIEAPANYHKWYARSLVKDGHVVKVLE
jgi:hypothetical protein